jgi:hypothetical protein
MKEIRAITGKSLLALICSLFLAFQPILGAPELCAERSAWILHPSVVSLPLVFHREPSNASESIAVAKLTGTADKNGQPLLNGSIVSSGDVLSTHGNSALLLSSTPQERLWLGPNTSARLTKEAENVAVTLQRGTLGFQTRGHIQVTFENHDGLAIRSRPESLALAQLSLINNQEAHVRLQEGFLELVQGDRTVLLQPEKSAAISAREVGSSAALSTKKSHGDQEKPSGQSDTGSISVTVVNAELFVVSGADVTLTSTSGQTLTAHTTPEGKFNFSNVPPGNYTLHVNASGYKSYELPNVVVRSGNESSLFVQLGGKGKSSNNLLLWVIVGSAAAGGIGAYLGTRGSSSSSTSPSTTQ